MREREAALALCGLLDRPTAAGTAIPSSEQAGLLSVAQRLSRLPELLPGVDPTFERLLLSRLDQQHERRTQQVRRRWRVAAPALAAFLLLLAVGLALPGSRRALASFAARFGLGPLTVQVTPQPGGSGDSYTTVRRATLSGPQQASSLVDHPVLVPGRMPSGYTLLSVVAVNYEDMPIWIPQPLYLELEYGPGSQRELHHLTIREFGMALSEGEYLRRIRRLDFASEDVSSAVDVMIEDAPGVLLTMATPQGVPAVRRLIWQRDEVVLEILSQTLSDEQLLQIAGEMTDAQQ